MLLTDCFSHLLNIIFNFLLLVFEIGCVQSFAINRFFVETLVRFLRVGIIDLCLNWVRVIGVCFVWVKFFEKKVFHLIEIVKNGFGLFLVSLGFDIVFFTALGI